MTNFLLKVTGEDIRNNFIEMINDVWVIAGMVIVAIGIALIAVAIPAARAVRGVEKVPNNDRVKLTVTIVGVSCVLLGLLAIGLSSGLRLAGI